MTTDAQLAFDFYGVGVRIECADGEVRERIANDFVYFLRPAAAGEPDIVIRARRQAPDYESLPPLKAGIYSPRNICYPDGARTYIDYSGRGLSLYDRTDESLLVSSDDPHLLHEIVFLSVLSRVCERLERGHMHRVHALGVESNGEAALFMMPSGGGKTTLAMEFLRRGGQYKVISEDSPLIDRAGRMLPFPLRFGVVGAVPEGIAEEHVTYIERMEFEPKYLIALAAFEGSIATTPSRPRLVFIGDRTLGRECSIRPVGFGTGLRAFLRHMIVGVGLYQGVEFLLQSSVLDLVKKSGLYLSRLQRAVSVLRRADVYSLELGRDPEHNVATVLAFLQARGFGGREAAPETAPAASEAHA